MACYLFLITMGEKKNAGFIHVITGININTILSEKNPYRKGHPDPIFTMSALFFFFLLFHRCILILQEMTVLIVFQSESCI